MTIIADQSVWVRIFVIVWTNVFFAKTASENARDELNRRRQKTAVSETTPDGLINLSQKPINPSGAWVLKQILNRSQELSLPVQAIDP